MKFFIKTSCKKLIFPILNNGINFSENFYHKLNSKEIYDNSKIIILYKKLKSSLLVKIYRLRSGPKINGFHSSSFFVGKRFLRSILGLLRGLRGSLTIPELKSNFVDTVTYSLEALAQSDRGFALRG